MNPLTTYRHFSNHHTFIMKISKSLLSLILTLVVSCIVSDTVMATDSPANPGEYYQFERMWPNLPQPWHFDGQSNVVVDDEGNLYIVSDHFYNVRKFDSDGNFITGWGTQGSGDGQFNGPVDIALDDDGDIYVADRWNGRIQKFDSDGNFITKWGSDGSGDGQFDSPTGIAVDSNENVYVTDNNNRIQKFNSDGNFIIKWGSKGSGDGQFDSPSGIAVDSNGNVYVVDINNYRIQKFDSEGNFITKWGTQGSGDGQFDFPWFPTGIVVDSDGNVHVVDTKNDRIQKFDSDGNFISKWGNYGTGDGQFSSPTGIEVDNNGNVYVADTWNHRIQKFGADGSFITKWGSEGGGDGQFFGPQGITLDSDVNIYVADSWNDRIQKFDSDGNFITKWGSNGIGDGQFSSPTGIEVDNNGNVYVADNGNDRIQKFDSDGNFITKWGSEGGRKGQFADPGDIAVDSIGNVYVADTNNHRIQKFDSGGNFITKWGSYGIGDMQFDYPMGISVGRQDNFVYVIDTNNYRIQKFDSDGNFITKWGIQGSGDGQFNGPAGITVDNNGNVYVSEKWNHRIQKFDSDGNFITSIGTLGFSPGRLNLPLDIVIDSGGRLYVADTANDRVQVFKKVSLLSNSKAIVVAGGGSFPGNNFWDTTQRIANYAYKALTYQGYTKESIYYVSSDTDLDLDGNGLPDDVDADATNSNFRDAITTWASDADDVVVFLTDHGGAGTFRMSGTETLGVTNLNTWLNTLQQSITGKIIIIYDACESGSFMATLNTGSQNRIVVTSTSPGENAYFISNGTISFSNYFLTQVYNGNNISDSFATARDAINTLVNNQTPLLDANGNGVGNEPEDITLAQSVFLGTNSVVNGDAPVIGSVSPGQTINGTNSALLYADNVTDTDDISRVWATIVPPNYQPGSPDNPVQGLPSIDLKPAGNGRYQATYNDFTTDGAYQISINAMDRLTYTSVPMPTTVTVNSPMSRKAIIVAGGVPSDTIWPAVEKNAKLAYDTLIFQGYSDSDIKYLSAVATKGVDSTATLSNIDNAVNTLVANNTRDLVVYMIGDGGYETFRVNDSEVLQVSVLDTLLDSMQQRIDGTATVIYDGPRSGSFVPLLIPPAGKERIVACSAAEGKSASFASGGDISFSRFFWQQIANGDSVYGSYVQAKNSIANQRPQVDDNGNGVSNEKKDRLLSRNYYLGTGIIRAGDEPLIGSVSPDQTLTGATSATIWVDGVTTTGTIGRVWAVIVPPNYSPGWEPGPILDFPEIDLTALGGGRYGTAYNDFIQHGVYKVMVYAKDTAGQISLPGITYVSQDLTGTDDFEPDDTPQQAGVIIINDPDTQLHNFYVAGDQDWVKFYAISGEKYAVEALNASPQADVVVALYDTDGVTLLKSSDDFDKGEDELLNWTAAIDGIYYVMVKNYSPSDFGPGLTYELKLYRPVVPLMGKIKGFVTDAISGSGIEGAILRTSLGGSAISITDGAYIMFASAGTHNIISSKSGYRDGAGVVGVASMATAITDMTMSLVAADSDNDGIPDQWELNNFNNLTTANKTTDNDNDNLLDIDEFSSNTDPNNPDSDGDGMLDGWEVTYALNPLVDDSADDKDGDGLTNKEEHDNGTDPNIKDVYTGPVTGDMDGNGKDEVIIDYGTVSGIWKIMNNRLWSKVHNLSPKIIATADLDGNGKDDVIIDFGPGIGIWKMMNNSSWSKVHNLSPKIIATADLDGNGKDDVIIDFGPGIGIWKMMNNSSWYKVHNLSPEIIATGDLDGNDKDDVIIDFGPGIGIWKMMNNSSWSKVHNLSPEIIATGDLDVNGKDDVIIDFGPGIGIWKMMNNSSWVKLHGLSPEIIATGDLDVNGKGDVIIDFGPGIGIWKMMNNSSWVKLHGLSPVSITCGDLDGSGNEDIVIDFGPGVGIWRFMDNSTWSALPTP